MSEHEFNPYLPPKSEIIPNNTPPSSQEEEEYLLTAPRQLPLSMATTLIGEAWDIFMAQALMFVLALIVFVAAGSAVGFAFGLIKLPFTFMASNDNSLLFSILNVALEIVSQFVAAVVGGLLTLGFTRCIMDAMRGQTVEIGSLFSSFSQWKEMSYLQLIFSGIGLVFVVAVGLVIGGGFLAAGGSYLVQMIMNSTSGAEGSEILGEWMMGHIGLLLFGLLLFFVVCIFSAAMITANNCARYAVSFYQAPLWEAVKLAYTGIWQNIGLLLFFSLLQFLITLVGFLLCCVGLLAVIPLLMIANYLLFRAIFVETIRHRS